MWTRTTSIDFDGRCETVIFYAMESLEVDGIRYARTVGGTPTSPSFFSIKESLTAEFWNDPFIFERDCQHCDRPFELDERVYLSEDVILCKGCGNIGDTEEW